MSSKELMKGSSGVVMKIGVEDQQLDSTFEEQRSILQLPFQNPATFRVDLQSLRYKLNLALKENAGQYWDLMKRFTQAKLSKRELDIAASKILVTPEHSKAYFMVILNHFLFF